MVGKCVSKENSKSDFDLDLGFVKNKKGNVLPPKQMSPETPMI